MWHPIAVIILLSVCIGVSGCASDNPPKRMMAYLPSSQALSQQGLPANGTFPVEEVRAALVVFNDTKLEHSPPELRKETLEYLGNYLKEQLEKEIPIHFSSVVFPIDRSFQGSPEAYVELARKENVPYLLLAVLSSSEWEVFDRLPLGGLSQPTGMRSAGIPGYRVENYARMELALLDARTGEPVVTEDGQAWALLERLAIPLESNVYPVVRRALAHTPMYLDSPAEAYETLRWVSGKDAIDQAVMHFRQTWQKIQAA